MIVSNTSGMCGYSTSMSIAAGETVAEAITVAANGSPINLAGYTIKMQIAFPAPLMLNTGNGGIAITDAAQGAFQINIADTTTEALPVGSFSYDLWIISSGAVATRLLTGLFTISQAITPIP